MTSAGYLVPDMHEGQVTATPDLARQLVAAQFPEWSGLPLKPVPGGTDHAMFQLGDELLARFPLTATRGQPALEAQWLPRLAPHLPLEVSVPVGLGEPGLSYPWQWTVVRWIPGLTFGREPPALVPAARTLAGFVRALHSVPATDGPRKQPGQRGGPVRHLDDLIRPLIEQCIEKKDRPAVVAAWEFAMSAPAWDQEPVWLHTDLGPDNVIVRQGRIAGIIDFGLGVGDPSPDLLPAWHLFSGKSRTVFLEEVGYDSATQARALAWLLAPAIQGLLYYRDTRPDFVEGAKRHIQLAVEALP